MSTKHISTECCILGAGPAGLGAACELTARGVRDVLVIDRNTEVGGLARTEVFDGVRFDLGPHRFFTKNKEINRLWHDLLGEDFRPVSRLTRIYYKHKFFQYPIKLFDVLKKLGFAESAAMMVSFAQSQIGWKSTPETFEEWMVQKFGHKLYSTFFKTYTEKIWGIPCTEIGAEWAAQRIKGLDVMQVLKNALIPGGPQLKTLVEEFDYPRLGSGQMYEAMRDRAAAAGARLQLDARIVGLDYRDDTISAVHCRGADGRKFVVEAEHIFTSLPMTHFFQMLQPAVSTDLQQATEALYYRDHITVNLLVDAAGLFDDQWLYIHAPDIRAARVANYNNFSPQMSGTPHKSALTVEYFAFQHESLWQCPDEELQALAAEELQRLGLVDPRTIEQSWVIRETEVYPVYYRNYQAPYGLLRERMDRFRNVTAIGRGGMYKYNNQDHSTLSGILAARNYCDPGRPYNLWDINVDAEYLESAPRRTL